MKTTAKAKEMVEKLDLIELEVLKMAAESTQDGLVFSWSNIRDNLNTVVKNGKYYSMPFSRGIETSTAHILKNFCYKTFGPSVDGATFVGGWEVSKQFFDVLEVM